MIVGDCETDGLYPDCTKIHCAVFYDTDKDEWIEFTPKNVHLIPAFLDKQKTLCMHNGIGFDLKVFKKLFNYTFKGYYIDSLIMCQVLFPDIEKNKEGKHSVGSWGFRFGIEKPVHEDWTQFSDEMLHRCKEDVKIQTQIYNKCIETINRFKMKDRRLTKWREIFQLEMDFWAGMEKQAENGWMLDIDLTYSYVKHLEQEIEAIDEALRDVLPKVLKKPYGDTTCTAFKKDGELTTIAKRWTERSKIRQSIMGDFCRVEFEDLNLNSSEQVKDFLLSKGWTPLEYNFKKDRFGKPERDEKRNLIWTTPKIPKEPEEWEDVAVQTSSPEVSLLANRSKMKHRYGMLKGFYDNVRPDRRIEARMIPCGTPTARATHICVVNVPKAEDGVFFGRECRSVFTVPKGKVLVGADASALEARCEAHYLYKLDKASAMMLIEGDIHTLNAEVWNVVRRLAKNGKYALTYGCSPKKLAQTLNKPEEMSKQLYDDFWTANPALHTLVNLLKEQFKSTGYLVSIDGRPLSIRYEHACLNTLLQSAGSIAMKKAWWVFNEWRIKNNLEKYVLDVGNFHDELQVETTPELAEEVGSQIVTSIQEAGRLLGFNVELTGEWKCGRNWAETH